MRKYLNILLAASVCLAVGSCTNFDDEIPAIDSTSTEVGGSVEYLQNGQLGVYLNLVPEGSTTVSITRSEGSEIENNIEDGWAFVYSAALPSCFDNTNENGYGHSSKLLELTELVINANNVAFFTFDQYPWVKTAGSSDFNTYGAIVDLNYYVDDAGYPIMTDGDMNYYFHEASHNDGTTDYDGYYAPHVYQASTTATYGAVEAEYNGTDGVDEDGGYTEGVDYKVTFNQSHETVPEGLYILYCYADADDAYGYYFEEYADDVYRSSVSGRYCMIDGNGVAYYATESAGSYAIPTSNAEKVLIANLRNNFGTGDYKYVDYATYVENNPDYTSGMKTYWTTVPFVGINHMSFIRFMVNLTSGTTEEVNKFVSQRMINAGDESGTATYFEEYKHLSVGLDGYYQVEIDETYIGDDELLTGGTPSPQGTYALGQLTNKHPMASPGIKMSNGLNEYTLSEINDLSTIYLVRTAAKVDVTTTDDNFSLVGVTLLNGAKRALMRSSVVDITGFSTTYSLSLPTNLCYEYRTDLTDTSEGDKVKRVGTIQYNEVLAASTDDYNIYNYKSTSDFPIYFFPNEGDEPLSTDDADQYNYSLSHYLYEDTVNISDKVNSVNPTYLIVRGYIAEYHERNGESGYQNITTDSDTGAQMLNDECGYYKIPIKYEPSEVSVDDNGNTVTTGTGVYTYDIIRNNYYQITLSSVKNAGYKTFEEAEAGPASDVVYDITVGDWSDDRNEYAVSNGTFYMETDVNDIFIKGYEEKLEGVTFNVTIEDNTAYEALTAEELLTKAAADPAYATPTLYITTSKGITLNSYVVNTYDTGGNLSTDDAEGSASADITTSESTVTTYSGSAGNASSDKFEVKTTTTYANTNVYEIDVTSGDVNTLSFTVTDAIETAEGGSIWVQAGDVYKEIKVYYEADAYYSGGSLYDSASDSYSTNYVSRFAVNGVEAYTSYNSIAYDEDYFYYTYDTEDYTNDNGVVTEIEYDYFSKATSNGITETDKTTTTVRDALAADYGQFLTSDGYVESNLYEDNGYEYGTGVTSSSTDRASTSNSYAGHYLNRECRAIVHRTQGDGIAKIYLKQATDFALLLGDGQDSDAEVAPETWITYTSRGYVYSITYGSVDYTQVDVDDVTPANAIQTGLSTNYGSVPTSSESVGGVSTVVYSGSISYENGGTDYEVEKGSNTPILFYSAGDTDRVRMVNVTSTNSYGVNTIINSESDAIQGDYVNDEFNGINFCSGGLSSSVIESSTNQVKVEFPDYTSNYGYRYTASETASQRSDISSAAQSTGVKSWYNSGTGDMFDLWAYPILRNQGTQYNESEWSYHNNRSYIDDKTVITLSNIAGETKTYTFHLTQHSLPFCDPSLVVETSDDGVDIIACNYPIDLGYLSGNASYVNYDSTMANVVGAIPYYNCYYYYGTDYSWSSDSDSPYTFSDTFNTSYVNGTISPQAYDATEPDYVVFTSTVTSNWSNAVTFTYNTTTSGGGNNTRYSSTNLYNSALKGRDYIVLVMRNAVQEEIQSAIQINRDDSFVETHSEWNESAYNTYYDGTTHYTNFSIDFTDPEDLGGTGETNDNTRYSYPHILDFLTLPAYTYTIQNAYNWTPQVVTYSSSTTNPTSQGVISQTGTGSN